jgi:hypothetical protein
MIGALLAYACSPKPQLYGERAVSAELHDVTVDAGDRLKIDGRQVLLADAQTPQPAPQAACRAESMIAERAAETVRSHLVSARHLEVYSAGPGSLALVNLDGLDLGQTLISEGLAVSRAQAPMDWCNGRS